MPATLLPSQPSNPPTTPPPIPYTGSPLLLCLSDLRLFFNLAWSISGILRPITQWQSGPLDELYPSLPNLLCLVLHALLLIFQALFLLSLPFLLVLPLWAIGLYLVAVFAVTWAVSFLLNGTSDVLHSTVDLGDEASAHEGECWIYLNGVSIGVHWLQSNLDRLALTFRRPIIGVHNRTYGILFDLLQCILERDFCYATSDIRRSYITIKASLCDPSHKKVVLILHSQGGIEGGLILDWLLTELPHDTVNKLEIYTFGSAANHFNDPPLRASPSPCLAPNPTAVPYIEHYASSVDFVARWGVLHFAALPNRFAGRVFVRPGTGHLLNQHYLDAMFTLDEKRRVREHNVFMDMEVRFANEENGGVEGRGREEYVDAILEGMEVAGVKEGKKRLRVRDISRLWAYRNGGSPGD